MNLKRSILVSLLIAATLGQEEGSGEEGSGSGEEELEIPEVINTVTYTMSSSDGAFNMR